MVIIPARPKGMVVVFVLGSRWFRSDESRLSLSTATNPDAYTSCSYYTNTLPVIRKGSAGDQKWSGIRSSQILYFNFFCTCVQSDCDLHVFDFMNLPSRILCSSIEPACYLCTFMNSPKTWLIVLEMVLIRFLCYVCFPTWWGLDPECNAKVLQRPCLRQSFILPSLLLTFWH